MNEQKNLSELITAYADGELSLEEKQALLSLADTDSSVRAAINREVRTKEIVRQCSKAQVPQHLRQRIQASLAAEQAQADAAFRGKSNDTNLTDSRPNRYWMPVAALLLLSLFLFLVQQYNTNTAPGTDIAGYSFEELTFVHFANHSGGFIQPVAHADTTYEAQRYLKEHYGCDITVPELKGADFAGVIYIDFLDGFHTPLLTYRTAEDTYIYIFAAELANLDAHPKLYPLEEAFGSIHAHNDVYIKKFNGHDVVSWKWHDVWYAGVSIHDGQTLAAMLPH